MERALVAEVGHIVGNMICGPRGFWTLAGPWRYLEQEAAEIVVLVYTENLLRWQRACRSSVLKLLGAKSELKTLDGEPIYKHALAFTGEMNHNTLRIMVIEPPRTFGMVEVMLSLTLEDRTNLLREMKQTREEIQCDWPMFGYIYTIEGALYATDGRDLGSAYGTIGPLEMPYAEHFLALMEKTATGQRVSSTWKSIKNLSPWSIESCIS
jgi:hypothetical protein